MLFWLAALSAIFLCRKNLPAAEKSAKLIPLRIAYVSRSILDMLFVIARDRAGSWRPLTAKRVTMAAGLAAPDLPRGCG